MEEKDLEQVAGGRGGGKGKDQMAACPFCKANNCSKLEVYTNGVYFYKCSGTPTGGYWKYQNNTAIQSSKEEINKAKGTL